MKAGTELSDQEWRQMRRQLSRLAFEPVPETPALLPRSLYGVSEKDACWSPLRDEMEDDSKSEQSERGGCALQESSSHCESPIHDRSSTDANPSDIFDKSPYVAAPELDKADSELPSTSTAVCPQPPPPPATNCYTQEDPSSQEEATSQVATEPAFVAPVSPGRTHEPLPASNHQETSFGPFVGPAPERFAIPEQFVFPETQQSVSDGEIATIDAQIAEAQDVIRRSVVSAFVQLQARRAKTETLERMKLAAAHTNDMAILQHKIEELKECIVHLDAQQDWRLSLLDRFSAFTVKRAQRSQALWERKSLLLSCLREWRGKVRAKRETLCAVRRAERHSHKQQRLQCFRTWKENVWKVHFENRLKAQQDHYEHRIVQAATEYQLKIQQLEQKLEETQLKVASSHKYRQQLEDDLRQVFLRGVSTMNIEALGVFGSNHQPNHNPSEIESDPQCSTQADLAAIRAREKSYARFEAEDDLRAPSTNPPVKEPTPRRGLDVNLQALLEVHAASTEGLSNVSRAAVPMLRSSRSQAPSYLDQGAHGWARPNSISIVNGLRSAEMVRKHELSPPVGRKAASKPSSSSSYRPSSAPSTDRKRSSSRPGVKLQVEMEYMRSTVAAAAAVRFSAGSRTQTPSTTRSPVSHASRRRT